MLGSFAVGKTSLVARFVHRIFSEKYHTTVGVRIDRKELAVAEESVRLLLWDIHGDDEFQKIRASYLRGMSGYLLVADGMRSNSLETAIELHQLAKSTVGDVPFILLLNKSDLKPEWQLDTSKVGELVDAGWQIRETSAKSGANVEEAFEQLARLMLESE